MKKLQFSSTRLWPRCVVKGLSILCCLVAAVPARTEILNIDSFTGHAQRCGSSVATLTLAAIAKTESRFQTLVVSDNTTHLSHTYPTVEQAVSAATGLIARGDSVDLGLMQINSANLSRLHMTVRDAFMPCNALSAAAAIMSANFVASRRAATQQIALRNAISMYNTGSATRGYRNGYVRKVEYAARELSGKVGGVIPSPTGEAAYTAPSDDDRTGQSWDVWSNAAPPSQSTTSSSTDHIVI